MIYIQKFWHAALPASCHSTELHSFAIIIHDTIATIASSSPIRHGRSLSIGARASSRVPGPPNKVISLAEVPRSTCTAGADLHHARVCMTRTAFSASHCDTNKDHALFPNVHAQPRADPLASLHVRIRSPSRCWLRTTRATHFAREKWN
jgi:hypothetical protein